ncbi:MAG: 6-carboxytetrahydropterin synthase QueD [Parachlamydiaceae bacterium]|nr:6-carboxytetrahydropterin synthase QueD [Parachlamydiaceae bacterium]
MLTSPYCSEILLLVYSFGLNIMLFELEKSFRFEAGHVIVHHDGKCRNPHGHSYTLAVVLRSNTLIPSGPKANMVIDFNDLSNIVMPMIDQYLDHQWLNDTLESEAPTVEFIAKWIFEYLEPFLPSLYAITVFETHSSKVTYRKY